MAKKCPLCGSTSLTKIKTERYTLRNIPQCESCGATSIHHHWAYRCTICKKHTEKLYGQFVPYACKTCWEAIKDKDRKAGNRCNICGSLRCECCC